MKREMVLYYLGAFGLFLSAGVFMEEPLRGQLSGNPEALNNLLILYGFPLFLGLGLFFTRQRHFEEAKDKLMVFAHAASALGIVWLILWCLVWPSLMMAGTNDEMVMKIKHTAYLHMFGVGFAMAGYAGAWLTRHKGDRSARFLMSAGWAVSYMAFFDLYVQPTLKWMWVPAFGGLLVVLGAFLILRGLKPKVEATSQLS